MFPPQLIANEREILRGGFGGVLGLVYTFVIAVGLAPTIILTPLALWFFLRSSRFVLTDRRLVVKPRFGKISEFTVEQLQGAKVTAGSATESVSLDGPVKVRLRYQRNFEQVWGALLVMCNWRPPQAGPLRGPGCELCAHTMRESDQVSQPGISVLSGNQLAFIPLNVGMRKGGMGKKVALAAVGVREVTTRAWYPHYALVNVLVERGGDFAGNVAALASSLGGLVWSLSDTHRKISKRGVMLMQFDERLEVHADDAEATMLAARGLDARRA
jgi:hypothetical protein